MEGGVFAFKPGIDANTSVESLLAAMPPSSNRENMIRKYYRNSGAEVGTDTMDAAAKA